jgi:hypothetical protein
MLPSKTILTLVGIVAAALAADANNIKYEVLSFRSQTCVAIHAVSTSCPCTAHQLHQHKMQLLLMLPLRLRSKGTFSLPTP